MFNAANHDLRFVPKKQDIPDLTKAHFSVEYRVKLDQYRVNAGREHTDSIS